MTVRLQMEVSQDKAGRLSGEIVEEGRSASHGFSGTLELLRVLDDLVATDTGGNVDEDPAGPPGGIAPGGIAPGGIAPG